MRRRSREGHGTHLAYRDLLLVLLGAMVAVVAATLPHVNPKARPNPAETAGAPPPGNVVVDIKWPTGSRADVDLWVQGPGDVPVGYSNKGGLVFNLLRDDLGLQADFFPENYENAFTRGVFPGEYVVNVHLYRNGMGTEVPVEVQVSVKAAVQDDLKPLAKARVTLTRTGQEATAVRFRLTDKGELVPGSLNRVQKDIRSGPK